MHCPRLSTSLSLASQASDLTMHPGYEFGMLLRKAYLGFHRRANARMLKLGITADQFVALSVIAQDEGLTQVTLVERTESDPNTVTAILALLERRGLVRRTVHAKDRRARCVSLTAAGRRIQTRAAKAAAELLDTLCEILDSSARKQVEDALRRIHLTFAAPAKAATNGRAAN
jgi:DNA-binding MarR family transcriptional regulator